MFSLHTYLVVMIVFGALGVAMQFWKAVADRNIVNKAVAFMMLWMQAGFLWWAIVLLRGL